MTSRCAASSLSEIPSGFFFPRCRSAPRCVQDTATSSSRSATAAPPPCPLFVPRRDSSTAVLSTRDRASPPSPRRHRTKHSELLHRRSHGRSIQASGVVSTSPSRSHRRPAPEATSHQADLSRRASMVNCRVFTQLVLHLFGSSRFGQSYQNCIYIPRINPWTSDFAI